jgi:NADPH-dependent ferric siderophore reductase
LDRTNGGGVLLETVRSAAFGAGDHLGWVACDTRTTRSVAKVLREDFGIPKKSIKAQAYWLP